MTSEDSKFESWLKNFTFENCKLNRGDYGEFIADYITGERDGFVLNLNGAWGTGKTEFLRRLYTLLTLRGHPTIYIDAWESDFSQNPLSVVSSELVSQLSEQNQNIGDELDKLGEYLGRALKGTIIGLSGLFTKYFFDDSAAGREAAKAILDSSGQSFLDKVKNEHQEQISAIKAIRRELGLIAEVIQTNFGKKLPVIVLVDELDRCRPSYAIEMLEVIKHFFATKNFVFVIASDTAQLKTSITAIYGSGFDSATYLRRFFNREAKLEKPNIGAFLKTYSLDEFSEGVMLYPDIKRNINLTVSTYLNWISHAYNLSLRDIDQLHNKLNACIRAAEAAYQKSKEVQVVNIFNLIVAIVEFDEGDAEFNERSFDKPFADREFVADFHLDPEFIDHGKFSAFYSLNLYNSVRHTVSASDDYHFDEPRYVLGTHSKLSEYKREEWNHGLARTALEEIRDTFRQSEGEKNRKLWLWKEYQKVVELAGSLV